MEANLHRLLRGRKGLRIIGDVHGNHREFSAAVKSAVRSDYAVAVLGDIIDYGPDSPKCMELAVSLMADGRGLVIPGNHDVKFLRWIRGHKVTVSPTGLGETILQLRELDNGIGLSHRYACAMAEMPLWQTVGSWHLVHAGFHPEMLRRSPLRLGAMGRPDRIESLALNGETDGDLGEDGKVLRTYGWLDLVPAGLTVCIGHDVASMDAVVEKTNGAGGRVLHLDTGSGEGGKLSWVDVPVETLQGQAPAAKRRRGRRGGRRQAEAGTPAT